MESIFNRVVTAKPLPEMDSGLGPIPSLTQKLQGAERLDVPSGDDPLTSRVRTMLLYDEALKPQRCSTQIDHAAIDAARLVRAANVAGLPKVKAGDGLKRMASRYVSASGMESRTLAMATRFALNGVNAFGGSLSAEQKRLVKAYANSKPVTWQDVLKLAKAIDRREMPPPELGEGEGEGEGESNDESQDKPKGKPPQESEGEGEPQESESEYYEGGESEGEGEGEGSIQDVDLPPKQTQPQKAWEDKPTSFNPWGYKPSGLLACGSEKLLNPDSPDKFPMSPVRRVGYHRRPELEGMIPKNWSRVCTDSKLFGGSFVKSGPKSRGTVLVDLSGSMSWTAADIKLLLEIMPESTIYGYSSTFVSDNRNESGGKWCLLADRGMAANPNTVMNWAPGGNGVDLPCLQILAKMPAPRLWISDGHISGSYDVARQIMESCNIWRVRHAKNGAAVLRDYARVTFEGLQLMPGDFGYNQHF